jgi:hypothetical protein
MDSGWRPATGIPASGEQLPLLAGHPGPLTIGHLAGLVARTAGLGGALEISALGDDAGKGASLAVEASDGASAYGTRPWLTVVEELGAWPSTTNHRRLWYPRRMGAGVRGMGHS